MRNSRPAQKHRLPYSDRLTLAKIRHAKTMAELKRRREEWIAKCARDVEKSEKEHAAEMARLDRQSEADRKEHERHLKRLHSECAGRIERVGRLMQAIAPLPRVYAPITEALAPIGRMLGEVRRLSDELPKLKLGLYIRSGKVIDIRLEKAIQGRPEKVGPNEWLLKDGTRVIKRDGKFVATLPSGKVMQVPPFAAKEIEPHRFVVQRSQNGESYVRRLPRT